MPDTVLAGLDGGVLTLTLNRPEALNSFNAEMKAALLAAFKDAARDEDVRVIILTGAGRAFSAGQDLRERQEPDAADLGTELRTRYNPIVLAMRRLEKPIIGAINGVAAGAGLSIALACDIRLAAGDSTFIEVFGRVGLVPDTGSTWFLPRLIGPARAAEMIFTTDPVDASTAERIGLVNHVMPAESLLAEADALAHRLAQAAPLALGLAKRALNSGARIGARGSARVRGAAAGGGRSLAGPRRGCGRVRREAPAAVQGQVTDPPRLIVGVVGAGTMGAGIAQVCLQAGHEVVLFDIDEAAIERGRSRIAAGLQRLVSKGRLADEEAQRLEAAMRHAHGLDALAEEANVVIEAAVEDLPLKETIFRALGASSRADTLLATNTSALPVAAIAEASGVPARVVGLHFFNPAPVLPLVEVVATSLADRSVVQRAIDFAADLGKQPVLCADSPGFIVNRVNRPFTLEALRMLEAGEAGVEQIDAAVRSGGYPMGPFELMDLVGVDINLAAATAVWHGFDEAARFEPSAIQRTLVDSGQLGRKTGSGFYEYADGKPTAVAWPDSRATDLAPWTILGRIELPIINEAYLAVGEAVAEPPDIDRAMRLGANHPHGPFERAGQLGLRSVVEGLGDLEAQYGERFRVARTLWDIANI